MKLVTMDVHSDICTAGIFHGKGAEVFQIGEKVIPTTIPDLKQFISELPSSQTLVIEEGPLASWLKRHLQHLVKHFVVTNPRRNALIYANADKDDFGDLKDLATIYITKTYREVYHTTDHKRQRFKDQVLHYHDHTQTTAAVKSKIKALFRSCGIRLKGSSLYTSGNREYWTDKLSSNIAPDIAWDLFSLLDTTERIRERISKKLRKESLKYDIIRRFEQLPGIGPITSSSFFSIIDTPWRFRSIQAVYKYCGLAVVNKSSNGKWLSRPGLNKDCNHILKSLMLTAAHNCRIGDNVLAKYFHHHLKRGLTVAAAKNHTARKIVQIMISMWKNNTYFNPEKVMIK